MGKTHDFSKEMSFGTYPVSIEQVAEYTRRNSRDVKIKGHYFSRALIKIILSLVQRLSWNWAYRVGTFIGELFYCFKLRRHVAMTNLDIVYGNSKSSEEKDRIYRESLLNFGRLIINHLRLPYLGASFWKEKCTWKNERIFKDAMNRKKGVIIISGHIGLIDLSGGKIGMSGYPLAGIAKRIKNPVFDKFVVDARKAMNFGTIGHRNSMKRILKGLKQGEAIAMALDQNMKLSQGTFINWMGRQASSVYSPASIARKTGAPVIAAYCYQKGPDKFELVITEEITWEPCPEDREKEILINAQKQADAIQKIIYEHPELWFWIHRRWKTQPKGLKNPYR